MKKRIWMTETDYKNLKAAREDDRKRANHAEDRLRDVLNGTDDFARTVIDTFGLTEQYPIETVATLYRRVDGGARQFITDVEAASKHASAKGAVKRLRKAVREAF